MKQLIIALAILTFTQAVWAKGERRILGTWILTANNADTITIDIKEIGAKEAGARTFVYDAFSETVLGFAATQENSVGYIKGRNIFFNVNFINGHNSYVARLNKKGTFGSFFTTFVQGKECDPNPIGTTPLGNPILACDVGIAQTTEVHEGVMERLRRGVVLGVTQDVK